MLSLREESCLDVINTGVKVKKYAFYSQLSKILPYREKIQDAFLNLVKLLYNKLFQHWHDRILTLYSTNIIKANKGYFHIFPRIKKQIQTTEFKFPFLFWRRG